ncbi:RNA-binding protein [Dehalogenimonas sp. WBC-2]|nr:RNA-binding protein [Dehalogenimonas sp. WBC-2]
MNCINIYVGNVEPSVTETELKSVFSRYGLVEKVTMVKDEDDSVQARGHGYVEMPSVAAGNMAIAAINGARLRGQELCVVEAMPLSSVILRTEKPRLGRRGRR